jgi:hypothetical protein
VDSCFILNYYNEKFSDSYFLKDNINHLKLFALQFQYFVRLARPVNLKNLANLKIMIWIKDTFLEVTLILRRLFKIETNRGPVPNFLK